MTQAVLETVWYNIRVIIENGIIIGIAFIALYAALIATIAIIQIIRRERPEVKVTVAETLKLDGVTGESQRIVTISTMNIGHNRVKIQDFGFTLSDGVSLSYGLSIKLPVWLEARDSLDFTYSMDKIQKIKDNLTATNVTVKGVYVRTSTNIYTGKLSKYMRQLLHS